MERVVVHVDGEGNKVTGLAIMDWVLRPEELDTKQPLTEA